MGWVRLDDEQKGGLAIFRVNNLDFLPWRGVHTYPFPFQDYKRKIEKKIRK